MRSRASALSGARPRFVWRTTPVALITGLSENVPWRPICSRTRSPTAAASRILGEPGPQLVEVRGGQALALERAGPLDRERLDEAVALGSEPPRLAHEIGQPGRHAHSFT